MIKQTVFAKIEYYKNGKIKKAYATYKKNLQGIRTDAITEDGKEIESFQIIDVLNNYISKDDTLEQALNKSQMPMSVHEIEYSLKQVNNALETGYHVGEQYRDLWKVKHNLLKQERDLRESYWREYRNDWK